MSSCESATLAPPFPLLRLCAPPSTYMRQFKSQKVHFAMEEVVAKPLACLTQSPPSSQGDSKPKFGGLGVGHFRSRTRISSVSSYIHARHLPFVTPTCRRIYINPAVAVERGIRHAARSSPGGGSALGVMSSRQSACRRIYINPAVGTHLYHSPVKEWAIEEFIAVDKGNVGNVHGRARVLARRDLGADREYRH